MVDVCIPICDGEPIHTKVISALMAQTVPYTLRFVSRPRNATKAIGACENRNTLKRYCTGEFSLFLDSDVVLADENTILRCVDFLRGSNDYDAVAVDTKGVDILSHEKKDHVCIACVLIRGSILDDFDFRVDKRGGCECRPFYIDVNVTYLRGTKATEIKGDNYGKHREEST